MIIQALKSALSKDKNLVIIDSEYFGLCRSERGVGGGGGVFLIPVTLYNTIRNRVKWNYFTRVAVGFSLVLNGCVLF